jgi:SAM-dependent methyltransferase
MNSGGPGSATLSESTLAAEPEIGQEQPAAEQAVTRARRTAKKVRTAAATAADRESRLVTVFQSLGQPVTLLRAGCLTPLDELGLDKLRENGFVINVVTVDQDHPQLAGISGSGSGSGDVTVGDLRSIPLPPRSYDIVHCSLLLDRIGNVALVLDRFGAALRPGGLLLLRIRDRDCAAGFLDRRLPGWARRALWTRLYPGEPGPFPAVYEPTASARGIAAYMLLRGMVITQRRTVRTLPEQPERLCHRLSVVRGLIAWLSRGKLPDTHDEVLFVIRKPEDRFARVVLTPRHPRGVSARD